MDELVLVDTSSTATINAPLELIDLPTWLFTLTDAEFQSCSPAHVACAATHAEDGRRISINVENIGGDHVVQHYLEDISEKAHCRVVSISDVFNPAGRTTNEITWELTAKKIDDSSCEFTCRVLGRATPAFLEFIGKSGVPFEVASKANATAAAAHVKQETPMYAKSVERHALASASKQAK